MTSIRVVCQKCNHAWHRIGTWTVYEREAAEALPCPACGAYTLSCPEPTATASTRLRPIWNRRAKVEGVQRAG